MCHFYVVILSIWATCFSEFLQWNITSHICLFSDGIHPPLSQQLMPDSSGAEWLEIFSPPVNKWSIHLKQQRHPHCLPTSWNTKAAISHGLVKTFGCRWRWTCKWLEMTFWIYIYKMLCKLKPHNPTSPMNNQKKSKCCCYFCSSKQRCFLAAQLQMTALPNCADSMGRVQVVVLGDLKSWWTFQEPECTSSLKFLKSLQKMVALHAQSITQMEGCWYMPCI